MRVILSILFFGIMMSGFAQWHIVHEGSEQSNNIDLFFQNADTGFVIGLSGSDSYILRTHDGGVSWDSLWVADHILSTIYMTSADTGYIACFYETTASVMRTEDAGDSWQRIASGLTEAVSVPYAISFFNNNSGIVSMDGWARITHNAGLDWDDSVTDYAGQRSSDANDIYFVGMSGAGLVTSLNHGETFDITLLDYSGSHSYLDLFDHRFISSAIGNNGAELGYSVNSYGIITRGDILSQEYEISLFPELNRVKGVCWASENVLYAIGTSIYGGTHPKFFMKSIDGGETWFMQGTTESGYWNTDKIDCPNDTTCYAAGYGGRIYKTTNGGGPLLEEVTQVPLSVKEIKDDLNFSMAPNPTKGRFTLTSEKEQIKRVEVFDLQGKSVLTRFPKSFTARVDLTDYPSGVYLVQILAGDQILTGKMVVE